MPRAVLIGNYGQENFGDEALREYFVSRFPETQWTVLVAGNRFGQGEVPRLPLGFRSLFRPWWQTLRALWRADVVVFGGGSLFTDIESVLACVLWGWHVFIARVLRKPVILAAQGIGPFKTALGEGIARRVVALAESISVRDSQSADRVRFWSKNTKFIQVFDPVYALLLEQKIDRSIQNVLIVIPRLNSDEKFISSLKQTLASEVFLSIRIVSLEPSNTAEQEVCKKLCSLAGDLPCSIVPLRSISEISTVFSGAKRVITQRYHGAIVAAALGIPLLTVAQAPGDKIDALVQELMKGEKLRSLIALLEQELEPYLGRAISGQK